jgi:hypothetical protein
VGDQAPEREAFRLPDRLLFAVKQAAFAKLMLFHQISAVKRFSPFYILGFALVLFGCAPGRTPHTQRAFYFWRTVFDLSAADQKELTDLGITKLYARFFDVVFNTGTGKTAPVGDIRFKMLPAPDLEIIPVVFIANQALLETPDSLADTLAAAVYRRIRALGRSLKPINEIQLDCDWSANTKDKYFGMLKFLKSKCGKELRLSATIRLHQVKYANRTGIPPVDRGMLMFYNMGKAADLKTHNSIYDPQTAAAYLSGFASYPLPLDVALPCFSWLVVIQNGHLTHLINDVEELELDGNPHLELSPNDGFRVKENFEFRNVFLLKGEQLRVEKTDAAICDQAAKQIAPFLKDSALSVAIFHLKKNKYKQDEKKDLETVYRRFD